MMSGNSHVDTMLAGATAAFVVDMLVYPLDTLKTRQQSQDFLKTFVDPSTKTRLPSRQLFRGLYQGIGIVVVATLPAAGTFFTVYEASKSFLSRHCSSFGLPQPVAYSGASAIAECASCLVLTPAEVIKQNAQMLQRHESSHGGKSTRKSTSLQALRQLGGADAGRRLLSGYAALVARNLPFTAIQFPIFEHLRTRLWRRYPPRNGDARVESSTERGSLFETGLVTGTSAGLAGSFAAAITTPMDVVKTRLMLAAGSSEQDTARAEIRKEGSKPKYHARGGLAVAREVVAERGITGLFRGAILRSVWTAVGSGLYLGMYEVAKTFLTRGREDDGNSFP
ncbi:mitochondrial carrier domain-containing protein [Xylaria bambusicola]|uniref:mitochondrial carrier domain-containing protein n=1 Tax=Xylaria bambusicola TaxID=326684 RepID=UPI0020078039|nr:mitochondrial carrier domain-containing protein [Xylaria bambusicola]KAI0509289.1 mitochondrial carrier domain-containing protein [Xylaria bambusicola]